MPAIVTTSDLRKHFALLEAIVDRVGARAAFHGGVVLDTKEGAHTAGHASLSLAMAIWSAAEGPAVERLVRKLVAGGVDINERFNSTDYCGDRIASPLLYDAMERGTAAYVALLLSLGADPTIPRETAVRAVGATAGQRILTSAEDVLHRVKTMPGRHGTEVAAVVRSFMARKLAEDLLAEASRETDSLTIAPHAPLPG